MEEGALRSGSHTKMPALRAQAAGLNHLSQSTTTESPFAHAAAVPVSSKSPGQGILEAALPMASSAELVAQAATITVAGPARTARVDEGLNSAYADFKSQSRTFQDVSIGARAVSLPNLQLQNRRLRDGVVALNATTLTPPTTREPKQRSMSIEERLEMHERIINERLMLTDLALEGMARSDSNRPSVSHSALALAGRKCSQASVVPAASLSTPSKNSIETSALI